MIDLNGFVLAEAGTGHMGDVDKAVEFVLAAAEAGADGIKFQMFAPDIQKDMFCWIEGDEERSERWEASTLTLDQWQEVKDVSGDQQLEFLASVFQTRTVEWLSKLNVSATKVASRAARDFPYGDSPGPYLVSNGMYPIPDRSDVVGLQCEANYPSKAWWGEKLPGFSDHSAGMARPIHALAKGCKIVEVHFFCNEEDAGPDLPASLNVDQLAVVCRARDVMTFNQPER